MSNAGKKIEGFYSLYLLLFIRLSQNAMKKAHISFTAQAQASDV